MAAGIDGIAYAGARSLATRRIGVAAAQNAST
jgi:hypothetical protein